MTGVELIAAERHRQRVIEGYGDAHDADHVNGELANAAACYAAPSMPRRQIEPPGEYDRGGPTLPILWPWDRADWKPTGNRIRDLTKAGALIAAEIDRLRAVVGEQE